MALLVLVDEARWIRRREDLGSRPGTGRDENDSIDPLSYAVNTHEWKGEHVAYEHKRVSTLPLLDYHIYGCEYTPASVKYFFDGDLVQTVDISALPQGEVNIWLTSIALSSDKPDTIDNSRLPGRILVDYVRYYRKAGSPSSYEGLLGLSEAAISDR